MSTHRQILEAALTEERVHLWADLSERLRVKEPIGGDNINRLISRIRRCCEALATTTDWRKIPMATLAWWELVETIPEIALEPRPLDWPDFYSYLTDPAIEFQEVRDEAIWLYGLASNYPIIEAIRGDHL